MKKFLLSTMTFAILAMSVSALDTLKINIGPSGSTEGFDGWESFQGDFAIEDKTLYEGGAAEFEAFGSTVEIEPIWGDGSDDVNDVYIRSIARSNSYYSGEMVDILSTWIGLDSQYENGFDMFTFVITGLPEGSYIFKSYHHDTDNQDGFFSVEFNGEFLDDQYGISHSNGDTEETKVVDTDSLVTTVEIEFESSGDRDGFEIIYTNTAGIGGEAVVPHDVKILVISALEIIQLNAATVETPSINSPAITIANTAEGVVSILGQQINTVEIYSVCGQLVNSVFANGNNVEVQGLQNGVYIAKVKMKNGQLVNQKFIVR